jgi:nucleoside-diphosphate-sugar epimerase
MHVLVIGGTHFIGPHVIRRLVDQGHDVWVFHRGQTEADLPNSVGHIHGDRENLDRFAPEFKQFAPEVVLDTCAMSENDAIGVMRTFRGLARRLVVPSSGDVYRNFERLSRLSTGPTDPIPLGEDAALRDHLFIARSVGKGPEDKFFDYEKILVERVVMGDPQLSGTVLRLPMMYGTGDYLHRLFPYLKRMDDDRPAILLEEGQGEWRWTRGYVENVAAAIALAVTDERAAGRIYNVGEKDVLSEAEWVRAIAQAVEWRGNVVVVPKEELPPHLRTDMAWDYHIVTDTGRIRCELGY